MKNLLKISPFLIIVFVSLLSGWFIYDHDFKHNTVPDGYMLIQNENGDYAIAEIRSDGSCIYHTSLTFFFRREACCYAWRSKARQDETREKNWFTILTTTNLKK